MNLEAVKRIERELGVQLPRSYAAFLVEERSPAIDAVTAADDADVIIEWTKKYQNGFGDVPGWPQRYVYVGDEDDACPYALDCESGTLVKTDHGYLESAPLEMYESFAEFIASLEDEFAKSPKYWQKFKKNPKWWWFAGL